MADPKATYYSPNERGLATVLQPGPNFFGMAMQAESVKARREQLAAQAQNKAGLERERQVGRLVDDLSRPTPTGLPYQEEVVKRKTALINGVKDMYSKGADASEIRFKTATGIQELIGYATAGKQLYEGVLAQTKQLDKKKYKVGEITAGLVSKVVGEDGTIIDPQTIDVNDLNAANFVYESERPWDYLNQNAVVADFLKNPKFKETISEIQQNLDAGKIGRFTTFNEKTTITKGMSSLYDINGVSGNVKLLDPDTLIQNGVFQLAMNDRDMAAVVEGEVQKLTENRLTPLEGKAKDLLSASVLRDILTGATPGPQTIERVSQRQAPTYTSSGGGGKMTQGQVAIQEYTDGTDKWVSDVTSNDINLIKEGFVFASKSRGIGETSTSVLSELAGVDPSKQFKEVRLSPPSGTPFKELMGKLLKKSPDTKPGNVVYVKFDTKDGDDPEWVAIDREKLSSELSRGAIYDIQDSLKYGYKQKGSTGRQQMQGSSHYPAPASNNKKKIGGF